MPITLSDIEREEQRREQLAELDALIDEKSRDFWPELRGAVAQLFAFQDSAERPHEVMIAGPAETGKTFGTLWLLDFLMRRYAGAQAAICRKLRSTMDGSVLNTWRRVIAIRGGVKTFGGEKPEFYDYPNGSRVWVAGLDNPGKALSSERDFVYVNQAEDLILDDWQTLTTRTTGRGSGAVPWSMLFGDCNPSFPYHWIVNRPSLTVLQSRHVDNPSLYRADETPTAQGLRTMTILEALEGVLRDRLLFGRWVSAEGIVYPGFDRNLHTIDAMPRGWQSWTKYRAIDFGFTNPFVCLWAAVDPDGRIYIYRQIYMSQRTIDLHADQIKELERWTEKDDNGKPLREKIAATVADHDAGDRATLQAHGIPTVPADKTISAGLQAVARRLRKAGDGEPRVFILKTSLVERDSSLAAAHHPIDLIQEFESYSWPKGADGKPLKEVPIDLYNHALDALRYLVKYLDRFGGGVIR